MSDINKAVKWAMNIAEDNRHGYDQTHRNGPDYDCSSLVGTALNQAGFNVKPTSTTRNLLDQLLKCGFVQVSDDNRKAGDIHLKVGKHVAMSTDTLHIVHARINEKGTATGGKTGDQTGSEIAVTNYYNYPWDYHLRYNSGVKPKGLTNDDILKIIQQTISGRYGSGDERRKKLSAENVSPLAIQIMVNFESNDFKACYEYICSLIALTVETKKINLNEVADHYSLTPEDLDKRMAKTIKVLAWEQA